MAPVAKKIKNKIKKSLDWILFERSYVGSETCCLSGYSHASDSICAIKKWNLFYLYPRISFNWMRWTCWQQLPWCREVWMETDERREMLSLSLSLGSLCFLRVTRLLRDWQRHDSCGKQKVLHVHRAMSMEWVFENNKSLEKAWCPEPHLNWISHDALCLFLS